MSLILSRIKLPFGIASQGKAFRNEITPGNFIFRTREFDLMEFEYFIKESDWKEVFDSVAQRNVPLVGAYRY